MNLIKAALSFLGLGFKTSEQEPPLITVPIHRGPGFPKGRSGFLGRKHTAATRLKMSEAHRARLSKQRRSGR